ncbi:GtrA family protein [Bacillus sp. AK128]
MNQGPLTLLSYLRPTNSFVRFLLVGVLNTLVGLSMIFLMIKLGMNYWSSTFVGNGIGAAVSFLLNRTFTFKSSVSMQRGIPLFILVILVCYFSSYTISKWMVSFTFVSAMVPSFLSETDVAILLGAGLYTFSNYLGQKYIVFS